MKKINRDYRVSDRNHLDLCRMNSNVVTQPKKNLTTNKKRHKINTEYRVSYSNHLDLRQSHELCTTCHLQLKLHLTTLGNVGVPP